MFTCLFSVCTYNVEFLCRKLLLYYSQNYCKCVIETSKGECYWEVAVICFAVGGLAIYKLIHLTLHLDSLVIFWMFVVTLYVVIWNPLRVLISFVSPCHIQFKIKYPTYIIIARENKCRQYSRVLFFIQFHFILFCFLTAISTLNCLWFFFMLCYVVRMLFQTHTK